MKKLQPTKAAVKSRTYLSRVFKSKEFNDWVKKIRNIFKIPRSGFTSQEEANKKINKLSRKLLDDVITWKCLSLAIDPGIYREQVTEYILFDSIEGLYMYSVSGGGSLVKIKDINSSKKPEKGENLDDTLYPIRICISPYATRNDVVSYIDENMGLIENRQKEYSNPKVSYRDKRSRGNELRDLLVYRYRDMPHKQLREMINNTFPDNQKINSITDISKIISKEKKLRK